MKIALQESEKERGLKMGFILTELGPKDLYQFKLDMQEAFQKGFEAAYGETDDTILPEEDVEKSLQAKGAIAYKAVVNGQMIGGAVVVINEKTQCNQLHLLYVKYGIHSRGIGKMIWERIEQLHSQTEIWETCTPYFEKRNIHFYVNKCGFYIVEYQREINEEGFLGDGGDGMFVFKKWMKKNNSQLYVDKSTL